MKNVALVISQQYELVNFLQDTTFQVTRWCETMGAIGMKIPIALRGRMKDGVFFLSWALRYNQILCTLGMIWIPKGLCRLDFIVNIPFSVCYASRKPVRTAPSHLTHHPRSPPLSPEPLSILQTAVRSRSVLWNGKTDKKLQYINFRPHILYMMGFSELLYSDGRKIKAGGERKYARVEKLEPFLWYTLIPSCLCLFIFHFSFIIWL